MFDKKRCHVVAVMGHEAEQVWRCPIGKSGGEE
jgi:hypothetical protein